jgi:hypothetical protein
MGNTGLMALHAAKILQIDEPLLNIQKFKTQRLFNRNEFNQFPADA